MQSLATVRTANAIFKPPLLPTAVCVGVTSGIGQAMVETFARYTKGNTNIVIIGRNRESAEQIIASIPKPTSTDAEHQFLPYDASLMKNVVDTTHIMIDQTSKDRF